MRIIYYILFASFILSNYILEGMTQNKVEKIIYDIHNPHKKPSQNELSKLLGDLKNALAENPKMNIDITPNKYKPLLSAIKAANPEEVKILLEFGANPNIKSKQDDEAIVFAIKELLELAAVMRMPLDQDLIDILKQLLSNPSIDILSNGSAEKAIAQLKEGIERMKEEIEKDYIEIKKIEKEIEISKENIATIKEIGKLIVDGIVKQKEKEGLKMPLKQYFISKGIPEELVDQYIFAFAK